MDLFDFDDNYKPPFSGRRKEMVKDNFTDLQNLGHKERSEDYQDEIEKL